MMYFENRMSVKFTVLTSEVNIAKLIIVVPHNLRFLKSLDEQDIPGLNCGKH